MPLSRRILLFFLFSLVVSSSCKSVTPSSPTENDTVKALLGNNVELQTSPSGAYVLHVQVNAGIVGQLLRFVVVDATSGKILAQDSFMPGYVKWIGPETLEVLSVPGMLKKDEDLSKFIRQVKIQPLN